MNKYLLKIKGIPGTYSNEVEADGWYTKDNLIIFQTDYNEFGKRNTIVAYSIFNIISIKEITKE